MLKTEGYTIHLTRGDTTIIDLTVDNYTFKVGDKIEFRVYNKKMLEKRAVLSKSIVVQEETSSVAIELTTEDTKIGEIRNKSIEYWYEIELNDKQTIIGYDNKGPKTLILYPKGVKPGVT